MHTRPSKFGSYEAIDYKTLWLAETKDIRKLEKIKIATAEKEDYDVIHGHYPMDFAELSALMLGIGYLLWKTILTKSFCQTCKDKLRQFKIGAIFEKKTCQNTTVKKVGWSKRSGCYLLILQFVKYSRNVKYSSNCKMLNM